MNAVNTTEVASYQAHIQGLLAALAKKSGIPGICLEMAANGVRVNAAVGNVAIGGPAMTSKARFEIGSISKVLLSLVILELAAREKVSLDAPLGSLLPEFDGSEIGQQVLLWHLMSHSGGYKSMNMLSKDVRENQTWEQLVSFLRETPMLFKPGTVFSYTATAPVLLARIIEQITGQPALDVARIRLLEALGLTAGNRGDDASHPEIQVGSHVLNPRDRKYMRIGRPTLGDLWLPAFSDFTLSITDVVTLAESIATSRDSKGSELAFLHDKAAASAQKQTVKVPFTSGGPRTERLPTSVGLGCAEYLPDWFGYNGPLSGQSVCFRYHASHKVALAVGMNSHSNALCDAIIQQVLISLVGNVKSPDPVVERNALVADDLAGNYIGSVDGLVNLTAQGNNVVCELRAGGAEAESMKVLMGQDEYHRWTPRSDPGPSPLGFFRDPTSGTPCVMIGASAYKKAS